MIMINVGQSKRINVSNSNLYALQQISRTRVQKLG